MKFVLLMALLGTLALAQDVTGVANSEQLALTLNTVVVTVTAAQGDGTVCRLSKLAGTTIGMSLSCSTSDAKTVYTSTLRTTSATSWTLPFGFGDVLCLLGLNSTTAVVVMGSLGNVPATGAAWSCTTNIRTNGTVSGQTALTNGSVTWP